MRKTNLILSILLGLSFPGTLMAQKTKKEFKGQDPIKSVPTDPRAVAKQWKGTFADEDSTVFFSNDFPGGRLAGVTRVNDTLYECIIAPENAPINPSPWYAFKVWSREKKQIALRLNYLNRTKHRYMPKVSADDNTWTELKGQLGSGGREFTFELQVQPDTTWVAAQELQTVQHVEAWASGLGVPMKTEVMGYSRQGRPLKVYRMGNLESKNVIVILGRQHPPEVTGHFALAAFVEVLTNNTALAKQFRKDFQIYMIPMPNPDGVEGGFWRHNAGGVDMNRDWATFKHPETRAIRDYFKQQLGADDTLYFMIDFHSTYEDIYYTLAPEMKRNTMGLLDHWMDAIRKALPDYDPHVKVLYLGPPTVTSYSYFYDTYGAESLIYEIGDATSRDFIRKKSEVSAGALMRLLEAEIKKK